MHQFRAQYNTKNNTDATSYNNSGSLRSPQHQTYVGREESEGQQLCFRAYFGKTTLMKMFYEEYSADEIQTMALGKEAGVAIVVSKKQGNSYFSQELPAALRSELDGWQRWSTNRKKIQYLSMGPRGRFFLIYTDGTWAAHATEDFSRRITSVKQAVRSVALLKGDGWIIVYNNGEVMWQMDRNFETQVTYYRGLFSVLQRARSNRRNVKQVSAGWDGEWFVKFEDGSYDIFASPNEVFVSDVERIHRLNGNIEAIEFGGEECYVIFYTLPM